MSIRVLTFLNTDASFVSYVTYEKKHAKTVKKAKNTFTIVINLVTKKNVFKLDLMKLEKFSEEAITLVNVKHAIKPFKIYLNQYKSANELNLEIYNRLPENVKYKTGRVQLKKNLYEGFHGLFNGKKTSYLGWIIKRDKASTPPVKSLASLPISNIGHSKNFNLRILEHFQEFYTTFIPNKLLKWNSFFHEHLNQSPSLLSNNLKFLELQVFQTFRSKLEFDLYLKTSPSCYYKLCYWLSQNPINKQWADNNHVYCENHHVFPVYLKDNYKIAGNIDVSFNTILVPWFTHLLLHALRYIEFGYDQDNKTLRIAFGKLCSTIKIKDKNANDLLKEQHKKLNDLLSYVKRFISDETVQKTIFEVETDQKNYTRSLNSSEIKNPTVKTIYENRMTWQNTLYFISDISFKANTIGTHKDLVSKLKTSLEKYFQQNPSVEKPANWDLWSERKLGNLLGKYLRQFDKSNATNQSTAFFGWSLLEFNDRVQEWQENHFIQKSRSASTKKNLDVLDSGKYQWINSKYKKQLLVEAKKYPALPYIVYDLVNLLPVKERPTHWENSLEHNGKTVSHFSRVINKKQNSYMGWKLEEST